MRNDKSCLNIEDINEEDVIKLFSHYDIRVSDIDIDKENNSANVYIEVNSIGIYTIDLIEMIIKKLKTIQEELIKEGLINDISLFDLYKGIWRISVNFKTEADIEAEVK
jgi:hypothetical protein